MFCPKCGSKNGDGAAFCGSCGAPMGRAAGAPAAARGAATGAAAVAAPGKPGSNRAKLIVAAVIAVVLVAVVAVAAVSCLGGGNKELLAGTYEYGKQDGSYSSAWSMNIAEGNKVTFTKTYRSPYDNEEESVSGTYELTSSVDGNNIYTAKDLRLSDGRAATNDDLYDIFGGCYGPDYSDPTIALILPEGYESGDVEGRWGVVRSMKTSDGGAVSVGGMYVIGSDGSGATYSINGEGTPEDVFTDASRTADGGYPVKVTNGAPGRYTVVDVEYGSKFDASIPVKQ